MATASSLARESEPLRPYERLQAAVVLQAVEDLGNPKAPFLRRLEALVWLALPETTELLRELSIPNPLEHFGRMAEAKGAAGTISKFWRKNER